MKWRTYYKHDVDMRHDSKILALRSKFGAEGYAVWCMMLETLAGSNDLTCSWGVNAVNDEVIVVDFMLPSELISKIIDYCVLLGLLTLENGLITCPNLNERIKDLSDKRSEAGKLGGLKKAENLANSSKLSKRSKCLEQSSETQMQANQTDTSEPSELINCLEQSSENKQILANLANVANKDKDKDKEYNNITDTVNNNRANKDSDLTLSPAYDYKTVIELWNSTMGFAPQISKVQRITQDRKTKIRLRTSELEDANVTWHDLFQRVASSRFLLGQNSNNWKVSIDWLIQNEKNWVKVIEGNYDNKQPNENGNQQSIDYTGIDAAINAGAAHAGTDF